MDEIQEAAQKVALATDGDEAAIAGALQSVADTAPVEKWFSQQGVPDIRGKTQEQMEQEMLEQMGQIVPSRYQRRAAKRKDLRRLPKALRP